MQPIDMQLNDAAPDGERDLKVLLHQVAPALHPDRFVYCSFPCHKLPPLLDPVCTFREREGSTVIVTTKQAIEFGLAFRSEWALITLGVHSSLEAVGLLARVCRQLAAREIPCNVVSGYYHDHLFVPSEMADEATRALAALHLDT
jgi:uncharacterized protein